MFMLVWVPEPVCQITNGNSAGHLPARTSSAAATIASTLSAARPAISRLTTAAARLVSASASISSAGICSVEIAKNCNDRWV